MLSSLSLFSYEYSLFMYIICKLKLLNAANRLYTIIRCSCEFLCSRLPKAAVGHIAFHHDIASVCAFVRTCVCHIITRVLTNVFKVYIQIYIDIYVPISLGGHNLGTFYVRKLKFDMLPTHI